MGTNRDQLFPACVNSRYQRSTATGFHDVWLRRFENLRGTHEIVAIHRCSGDLVWLGDSGVTEGWRDSDRS